MFFPAPRSNLSDVSDTAPATERFDVVDEATGMTVGFIDSATEFKYLGSIIHPSLSSDADVDRRIKAATAAFGSLKKVLTNKHLDPKVKGQVYVALCLSILLYGSEVWCLRKDLFTYFRYYAASITGAAESCAVLPWLKLFVTTFPPLTCSRNLGLTHWTPTTIVAVCVGRGTFRVCP